VTKIHLIRHAKAKNRAEWSEQDEARPLTKRGRREALALAERLADGNLGRLVSSPYVRCLQTLEPLALTIDLPIETTELLAEGTGGQDAVALLLSLAGDLPIACCTHGDVVHEVVGSLADAGVVLDGPREAPVASTWVLDVEAGRISGARFVEPPPR
jgi:8-oxo-dGTP diphosphatase